jgi:hypothetical protein
VGYELHITRKQTWFDDGPEITLDEWISLVRSDVEMRLDGYAEAETRDTHEVIRVEDPSLAVWKAYTGHGHDGNMAWLYLSQGNVVAKNPDQEIRRKMAGLARRLGARVQGDDGEFYDDDGEAVLQETVAHAIGDSREIQPPPGLPVPALALRDLFARLNEVSRTGYTCDHRFTQTTRFLTERGLPVGAMLAWLGENGGGCDCEIVFNVEEKWGESVGYEPPDEDSPDEDPEPSERPRPAPPPRKPWWRFW